MEDPTLSKIVFPITTSPRFIKCGDRVTAIGVSGPYSTTVGDAAASRYAGLHGRRWQNRQLMWSKSVSKLALYGPMDSLEPKTTSMEFYSATYATGLSFDTSSVASVNADTHRAVMSWFKQRYGFDIQDVAVSRTLATQTMLAPDSGYHYVSFRGDLATGTLGNPHVYYKVPYSVAKAIVDFERSQGKHALKRVLSNLIFATTDDFNLSLTGSDYYSASDMTNILPISGPATTEPQTVGYLASAASANGIAYHSKSIYPEVDTVGACVVTAHPFLAGIKHIDTLNAAMFLYEADYGSLAEALNWWATTTSDSDLLGQMQTTVNGLMQHKDKALQIALLAADENPPDLYDDPDIQDALDSAFVDTDDIDDIVVAGKTMKYWRTYIAGMRPRKLFWTTGKSRVAMRVAATPVNAAYSAGVYTFTHALTGLSLSVSPTMTISMMTLPTGDRDAHIMSIEAQTGATVIDGQATFDPITKGQIHIGQRSTQMRWLFTAISGEPTELASAVIAFASCRETDILETA